jgi:hypothetical protein
MQCRPFFLGLLSGAAIFVAAMIIQTQLLSRSSPPIYLQPAMRPTPPRLYVERIAPVPTPGGRVIKPPPASTPKRFNGLTFYVVPLGPPAM